jgi:hypothetical protein
VAVNVVLSGDEGCWRVLYVHMRRGEWRARIRAQLRNQLLLRMVILGTPLTTLVLPDSGDRIQPRTPGRCCSAPYQVDGKTHSDH